MIAVILAKNHTLNVVENGGEYAMEVEWTGKYKKMGLSEIILALDKINSQITKNKTFIEIVSGTYEIDDMKYTLNENDEFDDYENLYNKNVQYATIFIVPRYASDKSSSIDKKFCNIHITLFENKTEINISNSSLQYIEAFRNTIPLEAFDSE